MGDSIFNQLDLINAETPFWNICKAQSCLGNLIEFINLINIKINQLI